MALFDWNKKEEETSTPSKKLVSHPANKNYTEDLVCNIALTKGLYHNTYPGLKLAGSLAFAPISVPVWFMGIPIAKPSDENNERIKEIIADIIKQQASDFEQIHTISHRDGTCWIWPWYDSKSMKLIWEFIDDDSVVDIIKNIDTNEPIMVITEDLITVKTGYDQTGSIRRRRVFTKDVIEVSYTERAGGITSDLVNGTQRNVSGILPIPFSNNADPGRIRGNSDYERIIPDLKTYHDTELQSNIMLTKFQPKMIQNVSNYETWKNNAFAVAGVDSWADYDIAAVDLIINEKDESTTFEWPAGAYEASEAKLKRIYQKIVEGSGIPEIVWGLKTEGNRASVEESMSGLLRYVKNKRDQKTYSYQVLFSASIRLLGMVSFMDASDSITVEWNDMDSISEEVKSIIFSNYAQGIASIVDSAAMTKDQLFKLYRIAFPKITENDFEKFVLGLSDMAQFNQMKNMSYEESRDYRVINDTAGV